MPSQDSEASLIGASAATVVVLVVVGVGSTSPSWAPSSSSCSPGSEAPSRGVQDEKARAENEEAVDGSGP